MRSLLRFILEFKQEVNWKQTLKPHDMYGLHQGGSKYSIYITVKSRGEYLIIEEGKRQEYGKNIIMVSFSLYNLEHRC
jgi:hypothetical protein